MTLVERLAQVAVREAELKAQGFVVFELVKDEAFWNECGVFTAEDFDAQMDAECEKERRKGSYLETDEDRAAWEAEIAWMDAREAEWAAEETAWRAEQEAKAVEAAEYTKNQVFANYQDGWI